MRRTDRKRKLCRQLTAWTLTLALVMGLLPQMAFAGIELEYRSKLKFIVTVPSTQTTVELGEILSFPVRVEGGSFANDEADFSTLIEENKTTPNTLAISSSKNLADADSSSHIGKGEFKFTDSGHTSTGYKLGTGTCSITIDPGKYNIGTNTYYLHLYTPIENMAYHEASIQFNLTPPSLTLTSEPTSIHVGGTSQLTPDLANVAAGVAGKVTYTYSSSDESIATVANDGTVTGVKAGTVTIKAEAWYNNGENKNKIAETAEEAAVTITVVSDDSHTWSDEWSSDDTHHWHECTVSGCPIKDNSQKGSYGAHRYTDAADATCEVCGYERAIYILSTDPTTLAFGSATEGYTAPAAQTVTITNTGNQTVTLNNPTSTGSNFIIGDLSTTSLAPNETATFTVQPQANLAAGSYNETITITGTNGATAQVQASFSVTAAAQPEPPYIPPTPSIPSEPEPEGPATEGSAGWSDIQSELESANDGDAITVEMNGTTEVPAEIFETIAGQDITLSFEMEGGVSWQVNGTDIPAGTSLRDLDLGVTMNTSGISANVINAITGAVDTVQMALSYDGEFGFAMTLSAPLGEAHHGYWANLYYFDEAAQRLIYQTASLIDEDGFAHLRMSHASQYAIVIDDYDHGAGLPFTDVNEGDWCYDAVAYVFDNGIMTGMSDTTFAPQTATTRAMIVSMLHRLESAPAVSGSTFTDVSAGDWYAEPVAWAAAEGIVGGYDDGTFQPNKSITREELASILYRYAQYKGLDVSARADLSHYTDAPSDWAYEVVSWANAEGLITGRTATTIDAQATLTRAETAAIFQRFLTK